MESDWTPGKYAELKELFAQASELDPAERAAFLDAACRGNETLRREILALLACDEELQEFDAQVAAPAQRLETVTGSVAPEAAPGGEQWVGGYKLLEELGRGGMGVVYVAEQRAPVRRRVALKVIRPGMDSRDVVARFEAERQALARMSHAAIAQVHAAGRTADGRPYFVMELVAGVPITTFCDTHRLGVEARVRLLRDVCGAVEHAHRRGVLHRDLKPGNVLVTQRDGPPRAKVIDFGLAKAIEGALTEVTLATSPGTVLGTPMYMSPEQTSAGAVALDARSDVYALGVMLYELLTGVLPFPWDVSQRSPLEVFRAIREYDPPRPSAGVRRLAPERAAELAARRRVSARALAARLAPELDWIVLEAIEKDPGRRYQTVAELAAELDRALRGERVRAVRGGLAYALGKAARRHRRAAVALVIAALALGGGLLAGYLVWQDALASRRVAEERRRLQARVDALYDEYTLPEEVHAQIASDPTLGAAERALAAEIVEARTPPSPRELVGAAWRLVGDPGPSPPAAARALVMAERGLEEDDRLPSHALLLGVCRYRLEEYDEAVRALERAVSLAEEADDGEALAGSLAFLAMSRLLRGELEAALALRARLRDLGEPAREFLGEVEDTFLE